MSKLGSLLFTAILVLFSLIVVSSTFAQSTPKSSAPEFTLEYVDNSYDVPPTATSTTDPYTNKTTTTTSPGRHVENKTIEATIKNNLGASYYNFRYKGHYENEWSYYPFDPNASLAYMFPDAYSVPYKASTSNYTVASLPSYFFKDIPESGEVDVQVQALFGDFKAEPYGHIGLPAPTYDFYFKGTASDWSNTQTVQFGEIQTPEPSPMPNQELTIDIAIVAAVIIVGIGVLIYLIKRK
jgi:hypothetical protein